MVGKLKKSHPWGNSLAWRKPHALKAAARVGGILELPRRQTLSSDAAGLGRPEPVRAA